MASQSRVADPGRFLHFLVTLFQDGLPVMGWILGALGWGFGLRLLIQGAQGSGPALGLGIQMGLGAGFMMMADWSLGLAGWLTPPTAWALGAGGWLILLMQARQWDLRQKANPTPAVHFPWPLSTAAPAVGLMAGAACIAPGLLWQQPSENMAYDVLSYHLQLPKEWMTAGKIVGLEHNVYSYLPNLFEAAFLHLGLWRGSMLDAAVACQILHAFLGLAAAGTIYGMLATAGQPRAGAWAGAIYLATPWTVITGSIAYNEQAMMALGMAALALALTQPHGGFRAGLGVGFLAGCAALVKPTAAGMIGLPLGLWLATLAFFGGRKDFARLAGFLLAPALLALVWMGRNYSWCESWTFPFLLDGSLPEHWSTHQAQRFQAATGPGDSVGASLGLLNSQERGLWHTQYGYLVWTLAILGAILGLVRNQLRSQMALCLLMGACGLAFWIFFTHHQSRFLYPLLGPAALLAGLALGSTSLKPTMARCGALGALILVVCSTLIGYRVYFQQADGQAPILVGAARLYAKEMEPYNVLNGLPKSSYIFAEGFATPFYVTETPIFYHTVWDKSYLGRTLDNSDIQGTLGWLRKARFTHLIVDWGMLRLWMSPGNYGYDPNVRLEDLEALVQAMDLVAAWPSKDKPIVGLYAVPAEAERE